MSPDLTYHESRITHGGSGIAQYVSRIAHAVFRLEPFFILLISPLLIFPRPDVTPWLMAVVPLLWLCRWIAGGRLTVRTPLDVPILGLLLMMIVSLAATFDVAVSFSKLCGVFLGIALFYAMVNGLRTERGIWLAVGVLLAGGTAIAGVSLVGTRWGSGKIPVLLPFFDPLYRRLPLFLQGLPRAQEGFNANQVGGTMTLFIPLATALLLRQLPFVGRRPANGSTSRAWGILSTLGLAGIVALMALALLLTQSRLSYIAVVVALLLVSTRLGRWPRLLALVALLAGVGAIAYYGPRRVGEAVFGIGSLETLADEASWTVRVEVWKRALRVIQDHPLTGIGFDTLFRVIHARYPMFRVAPGHDLAHAHNIFLQVALDLGIPGLVAYLWLLVAVLGLLWRVWRKSTSAAHRVLAIGLLVGLLAQLIFGLADAIALGQKPGVSMWAYLGLGAALWVRERRGWREEEQSQAAHYASRFALHTSRARDVVAVCLVVTLAGGWACYWWTRARAWLSLVESDLSALQSLIWEGPRAVAPWEPTDLLQVIRSDLMGLRSEFALPLALAPYFGWLPGTGADVQALPALVQMSLDLTAAGEQVLEPFRSLLADPGGGGLGFSEETGFLVAALYDARPHLTQALVTLERVQQTRQMIPTARLSPQMRQWVDRFDRMVPSLESGAQGALALPELLGASEPRTYLILIQNDDELRPTGGFISGVARMGVENGRVVELVFEDSYLVDDLSRPYPDAPRPLYEIMGTELWFLRDSNWSPDFPSSARVAMILYWLRYGDVEVDGVLALDQQAIQLLVAALQPIELRGYPEPVTGENVIQMVRESWVPPGEEGVTEEWRRQRMDVVGRLLTAAVYKLQNRPDQVDLTALGWAVLRALEGRHLFVYLPESEPEVIRQAGWNGALADVSGDYLMVVDANLGFNKVNPHITESLSYTVDLQDAARPKAALTLLHRHEGPLTGAPCRHESRYDLEYEQMMQRCYWDYVRVYVPEGSRLQTATPHPVPGSMLLGGEERVGAAEVLDAEVDKAVFATFLVLAPQELIETRFVYDLPPGVVERNGDIWRYQLYVQKQGGTGGNEMVMALNLPVGAEVVAASPPPAGRMGDTLLYELELYSDVGLYVEWEGKGR